MCTRPAGWGTPHPGFGNCKNHGGCTPAGIIYATRLMSASTDVQYGGPVTIEPHEALLQEVYRAAGHVQFLHQKVAELEDGEIAESTIAGRVPSFWIRWYQDERVRLVNAAATAIKAGVAERRVAIAEEQGRMLAEAVRRILNDLGLSPEQERAAPEVVRRVLMSVPTGGQAALEA